MKNLRTVTDKKGGIELIDYYYDDVLIAKARKYSNWFCTVDREGRPSRTRNRMKKCREFTWVRSGLIQLIGHNNFSIGSTYKRGDFMNSYPDTTWGDTGKIPLKKDIIQLILKFKQ